jgi:hypothetical protein
MSWEDLIAENNAASSPATQAQINLEQQQTQGLAIQNRVAAMQADYRQQLGGAIGAAYASQPSQASGGAGGDPSQGTFAPMAVDPRIDDPKNASGGEASGVDSEGGSGHQVNTPAMLAYAQRQYAPVLPNSYSPAELQAMQLALQSGDPDAAKQIQQLHTAKVDSTNAAIQQRAAREYNGLYNVATLPDNLNAVDALSLIEPRNAERLKADGATDDEVRDWATKAAAIVHRAARMPVEYSTDGVARDATTKEEIPGFDDFVGMSAQQRADLASKATERVDTFVDGNPAKKPRWQVEGANSADDWLQQHVDMAEALRHGTGPAVAKFPQTPATQFFRGSGAGVLGSGAASLPPGQQSTPPSIVPSGGPSPGFRPQPGLQPGQPAPPRQGPQSGQQTASSQPYIPPPALQDWQTKAADPKVYADPDFKLKAPSIPAGQAMPPAQVDEQKAIAKARTDLLQDQNDNSKAAGQALRYYSLAADVLNSNGTTTGWGQQHLNTAAAALQQMGIPSSWLGDPSKAAELTKALTNAGLQNLKTTYGSKVTQNEVFLNLEHANPNADMPLPALRQLINDQTQNLLYDSAGAIRANRYVAAGNDPRQFDTWQQKYFPRQRDAVTPQSGGNTSSAAPVRVTGAADYAKLPSGARFITPDGKSLIKR